MKLTFRTKLTVLFFALSLAPLVASSFYFLRIYSNDKQAALFENQLQNVVQGASRLENLLVAAKTIDQSLVKVSKEIILLAEDPCRKGDPTLFLAPPVVSEIFSQTFARIKLTPDQWLKHPDLQAACAKMTEAPLLVRTGPKLPIPYLQLLFQGPNGPRLIVISMEGLSGASGSDLVMLSNPEGKTLWTNATDIQEQEIAKKMGAEISRFAVQAATSQIPSITRASDGENIIAYAPILPDYIVLVVASEKMATAPIRFFMKQSLLFMLGWVFIYLLAGKLAAARLSAPLAALQHASEEFGAGNLTTRINVTGSDEISKAQATFNEMAAQIVKLIEDTKLKAAIESDMAIVQKVQQWFFPGKGVVPQGHEIGSFLQMAQKCGGDWWGYVEVQRPQKSPLLVLMVGDAAGHGISSALLTASIQGALPILSTWLNSNPTLAADPRSVLRLLNQVVYRTSRGEIHMSFFVATFDSDAETLTASNAGHNKPYLLIPGPAGTPAELKPVGGSSPVLGTNPDETFDDVQSYPWKPSYQLFLYTDGLIDCMKGDEVLFDRRGLVQLLKKYGNLKGEKLLQAVLRDRNAKIGALPAEDDVAAIICSRNASASATPSAGGPQA